MIARPSGRTLLAAPALALSLTGVLSGTLSGPSASAQAVADALAPGWTALPAETIACIRVPDARGFLASLREGTVLGQRVLTEERLNGFFDLYKEQNAEAWDEFNGNLERVGLTPEDVGDLMQEPWGAGWIMAPTDARPTPRNVLVFWADIDDDRIDTLYTALDNSEDLTERAVRTDVQIEGFDVRQYAIPENNQLDDGTLATFDDATDVTHLMITRLPGRLVAVMGTPEAEEEVAAAREAGGDLDWDSLSDIETVLGVLARYLDATVADGDGDGFAPRLAADPGVSAATQLGRGDADPTLAEVFIDVPTILEASHNTIERTNDAQQAQQFTAVTSALGLDDLGAFGGSIFAADRGLQLRGFLGSPAPRSGITGVFDGATLPAEPPAWVPAGVGYGHLALDLSQVWDLVLDVAAQTGGPQAVQQMEMANGMTAMFIQTDLVSALRSLGTAHRFVNLPQSEEIGNGEELQPFAVVWDLADPGIVQRIIAFGKQQLTAQPGVTAVDEQGFTGLRFEQPGGVSGAALLGPSNLVAGAGADLTDRVVTSLNNPPAPADALAGSAVFENGQDVLPYRDGFWFQFSDGGRDMVSAARGIMAAVLDNNVDPDVAQRIEALLPSDADLQASVGASVAQMRLEDGGIVMEGALATPAAE